MPGDLPPGNIAVRIVPSLALCNTDADSVTPFNTEAYKMAIGVTQSNGEDFPRYRRRPT